MNQEELAKKMLLPSKNSSLEIRNRCLTFACFSLIVILVAMILVFVAQKGLSTFFVMCEYLFDFLLRNTESFSSKEWCASYDFGFLYRYTILSALIATPCYLCSAVFDRSVSPKGEDFATISIEPGWDSFSSVRIYWLASRRSLCSQCVFGDWFWDFLSDFCPLCHDFADRNLYDNGYSACGSSLLS